MRRILTLILLFPLVLSCGPRHTDSPSLPLVGISCGRSASGAVSLASTYTDAILQAGALPVVFPTVADEATARALVAAVDGVVFSGGEDLDPVHYGETVLNETVYIDADRDRSDLLLARAAVASGKPVLAICRGEQLMNVVLGGTLYQDIPTQVEDCPSHSGGVLHPISIVPGSVLHSLYGDSLTVSSFHHQGVKDLAPGVKVSAYSPEGLVEGYENDQVFAVQFHPEKMLQTDTTWLRLFRHFVGRLR